jgi:hypothetical protein
MIPYGEEYSTLSFIWSIGSMPISGGLCMAINRFDEILRQARQDLTPEEQLQLALALKNGVSTGNGTASSKSLYDALSARGLIGSIQDAPADLGMNPAYLEGFGRDD